MTFWTVGNNHFHSISAVEKVLDQETFTLKEVLEADDVLQEVLATNTKLVDYLRQESIISELVDIVVAPEENNRTTAFSDSTKTEEDAGKSSDSDASAATDDSGSEPHSSASALADAEKVKSNTEEFETIDSEGSSDLQDSEKSESNPSKDELMVDTIDDDAITGEGEGEDIEMIDAADAEFDTNKDDMEDDQHNSSLDDSDLDQTLPVGEEPIDYSKLATELLSTEMWCIMDAVMSNTKAMDRLWQLLEEPDRASTKQLTQLTSIFENLLEKRTDLMLEYMRQLPKFTVSFINYIDNPPLADLLLKIISTDHPESPTGMINLLYDQGLIPKLISRLTPDVSPSEQMAVGDFLKAFVTISGGNKADACSIGPNELSRQLVSEPVMRKLVKTMTLGGSGMCIAVGVIIEIIRKNNTDYDYVQVSRTTLDSHPPTPRDSIYLGHMVKIFAAAIPKFQALLEKDTNETLEMPLGPIKPLGFERFRICELYAELLHCSNMTLHNDHKGEDIVRERDAQRQKVWHPDQEPELNYDSDVEDVDVEAAVEVEIETQTETETDASALPDRSPASPNSPNALPPSPGAIESPEVEMVPKSSKDTTENSNHKEESHFDTSFSEDDSFGTDLFAQKLKQQEAEIRENPVIGDQLKLALNDNRCISKVFSMLFEYPWNNFLHNVVFDIVQQIFSGGMNEGYNKFLAINLFLKDKITERIVHGQAINDKHEIERKTRLGYVGHLTLISEEVVKFAAMFTPESVAPGISAALKDPEWTMYVNQTLLRLREQYNLILGGRKPEEMEAMDDEDRYSDDSAMGGSVGPAGDDDEDDMDDQDIQEEVENRYARFMDTLGSGISSTNQGSSDDDDDDDDSAWTNASKHGRGWPGSDDDDDDDEEEDHEEDHVDIHEDGSSVTSSGTSNKGIRSALRHHSDDEDDEEDDDDDEDDDDGHINNYKTTTRKVHRDDDDSGDDSGNDDDSNSDEEDLSLVRSRSYVR